MRGLVNCVLLACGLLFLAIQIWRSEALQVSRLKDYSNEHLNRLHGRRDKLVVPARPLPPETIVLEGGATTFVSSLDDFLASQSETSTRAPEENGGPAEDEDESELMRKTPLGTPENNSSSLKPEVATSASNESAQRLDRNSKLAIIYTISPPAAVDEAPPAQPPTASKAVPTPPPSSHDKGPTVHNGSSQAGQSSSVLIEPVGQSAHGEHQQSHHHKGEHSTAADGAQNNKSKPIPQHWQVKSLLNVTHDYPLAYSQIICGYVWPLMAAITLFTNLMIVFVLTQRDMRTPTNAVLTAIAIADIIPIVVPVPWFVYLFAMGNEKQVLYPPVACYFYQHSTRSISEIFYFLSTWLNVLLAIQDYLAACRPKLARKYCQIRVVVVEIILLTLLAFLLNLPQALKLVFKPVKFYYNGELTWGCKALQAKWFKDLVGEYVALYDDIFTAIIVLFVDGGPAVVLITLTALLIRQLQKRRIQGHKLMEQARTASKRRRERHRQQEYEASARVMIFVLLAFLAVKIPFATTYTLMIIQSRFEIHFVENLVDFQKAITLTDLVFVLSYPINFTIFCCCSKKFRHKCAQLLGECNDNSRTVRSRLMSSFSGSTGGSDSFRSGASFSQRHSLATDANRLMAERADSLATDDGLGGAGGKKLSLAEYANNSTIPPFKRRSQQQQQHPTAAMLSPRSSASSAMSLFASGAQNQTNRKLSRATAGSVHSHRCDGCEQQRRALQEAGMEVSAAAAASSVQLRRLLDEGRLCLECIVCYENIRSESSLNPTASQQATPTTTGATRSDRLDQLQQADYLRRISQASDSSFSWSGALAPVQPPPPPPAMRSLNAIEQQMGPKQQQLVPQIVTTTCESIREQTSIEEGLQEEEEEVEEVSRGEAAPSEFDFKEIERSQWEVERQQQQQHAGACVQSASSQEMPPDNYDQAHSRHSIATTRQLVERHEHERSSRANISADDEERGKLMDEASGRQQRSKSHDTHDHEWATAAYENQLGGASGGVGNSLARPATAMMARVCSSDPGDVHEQVARYAQVTGNRLSSCTSDRSGKEEEASGEQQQQQRQQKRRKPRQRRRLRKRRSCREWPQAPRGTDDEESDGEHEASGDDDGEQQQQSQSDFSRQDFDKISRHSREEFGSGRRQQCDARTTSSEQTMEASKRRNRTGRLGDRLEAARASLGSRQRSLSLSNSNLTTLPNATGMLADVLVSVLFGGASGSQQEGATSGKRAHKQAAKK